MEFAWDTIKETTNLLKHGISFGEAALVFRGPCFTQEDTRFDYGEVRAKTIGEIGGQIVIVVIHTQRDNIMRIISARYANRSERKHYNDHCKNQSR